MALWLAPRLPYNHFSLEDLPFSSHVNGSCSLVLPRLLRALRQGGLRALETFDLQAARLALADCGCPRHGAAACDCQMVVLLVYGQAASPTTLVLHGSDGETWISLPDVAQPGTDPSIASVIEQSVHEFRTAEGL